MKPLYLLFWLFISALPVSAQVYQGFVVPDNKGRFPAASEITQSSGLALDPNNSSFWTHNDQGNPLTKLYKFSPASGTANVVIEKQVTILNTQNLDWEDLAKDRQGNVYICQTGKNCNANSDPVECNPRYVFKVHKVSLAALNDPASTSATPETFYFKYPLSGYDAGTCKATDTVFVNCEAAVWFNDALYFFSKSIWSKKTNNCGGWVTGYTYLFKLVPVAGSSMQNPLVAQYAGKVNLKMNASDVDSKYSVTGADISPDGSVLSLITYGRLWQFRNFTDDNFFGGSSVYADYSTSGSDALVRGYEGVAFLTNQYAMLSVDGANGRVSGINVDSVALWVRNKNDDGPGSLRRALLSASAEDTIRFVPQVLNDTIKLSSPLVFARNVHIVQPAGSTIFLQSPPASTALTIQTGVTISLTGINIICRSAGDPGIINNGTLALENIQLMTTTLVSARILNNGKISLKGFCRFLN